MLHPNMRFHDILQVCNSGPQKVNATAHYIAVWIIDFWQLRSLYKVRLVYTFHIWVVVVMAMLNHNAWS